MKTSSAFQIKRIRGRLQPIHGYPDLIPFISVFFLFLFFFMLGSSFVSVSGIPVNLPSVSSVSNYSIKKYVVTIDRSGKLYFNDSLVNDLNQLKGKLLAVVSGSSESARGAIALRVDCANSFETVAGIIAMAEELNLNVFILAKKSTSQTTSFSEKERR